MTPLLEMRGIGKSFGAVRALGDVCFDVRAGEVHAICGENGAGKSTLMKVLSGVYPHGSYEGAIVFDAAERQFRDTGDSEALGMVIIHQELALIPLLSIAENIFLADPPGRWGVIDRAERHRRTRALLDKVGLRLSPDTLVDDLGVGQQQLVEIAKALSKRVRLLILDEPTASLNERDSLALLDLLDGFRAQGIASILISHKLNEISRVADRITVLRDGRTVETLDVHAGPVSEDRIVRAMVNRDMEHRYPPRTRRANADAGAGEVVFSVRNWSVHHRLHPERQVIRNVDFEVRRGEIVGIAGLMGAGRTEFAMSVFGRSWGRDITGQAEVEGRPADLSTVGRAIGAGLAYVTEDRKSLGLILGDDIRRNIALANLSAVARRGVIDNAREAAVATSFRARMRIRSSGIGQEVGKLSGGNQQKVVLSKWLFTEPRVLILDEPTRGIDVGAKYEIYSIIDQLAADGRGVVFISSEMPELLGMCDRICVMNEGRFVGEFTAAEATQEKIMQSIMRSGARADTIRPDAARPAPPAAPAEARAVHP